MATEPESLPSESDATIDDNFRALLEGLRTSLPGVQVLFGFLLTAPFQSVFDDIGRSGRISFTVAFVSSGVASVLLIAPSAHQRIRAPFTGVPRQSNRHLKVATNITIAGTVLMGIAIMATVFLVMDVVFGLVVAGGAAIILFAIVSWSWFFLPLVSFRQR